MSLRDSLNVDEDRTVLTLSTSSSNLSDLYLRIVSLDDFDGTTWKPSKRHIVAVPDQFPTPTGLGTDVKRTTIDKTQEVVKGTARIKLYKGNATVTGRRSPNSLYNSEVCSFETQMTVDPSDSGGFININGLRLSTWSAQWPRS